MCKWSCHCTLTNLNSVTIFHLHQIIVWQILRLLRLYPRWNVSYIFSYLLKIFKHMFMYLFVLFFTLFYYSYSADFPNSVPVIHIIKTLLIFCLVYFTTLLVSAHWVVSKHSSSLRSCAQSSCWAIWKVCIRSRYRRFLVFNMTIQLRYCISSVSV